MKFIWVHLMILSLIPGLLACQADVSPATGTMEIETNAPQPKGSVTQTSIPTSIPEEPDMTPDTPVDASAEKMIELVRSHLAEKVGMATEQILLSEVKAVVWRDASLGCPKPAVDYIQVETPGYRIVLEAGGNTYNYHTDQDKRFVLCRS